ncbi:hypothetical protein RJ641_017274 [Dillenia turbinata]|uniref:Endoplasmic reticulum transmembrane protein n=1 Tax=Dillenia turbinata TaxID=194707 RepID=A0AAN8V0P0_9MAGN
MIYLLFTLIGIEALVIVTLSFKTPLRKLMILGLDRAKQGRGPIMVKTVAATVLVVMMTSVYGIIDIQRRFLEAGSSNPTDQILFGQHLLEASLMGFLLFLGLMIDRVHNYIRELRLLRKTMEVVKQQNLAYDHKKDESNEQIKALTKEIAKLKGRIQELESECETKAKEAKAAEANSAALKKQSDGFLLEYDRLLEDNQNLRNQLRAIDGALSQSDNKKNT